MAFTQPSDPLITSATGKFKVLLGGTVDVGDPIGFDASNNYAVLAEAATPYQVEGFAIQRGIAGDTVECAVIITVETRSGVLALSTDFGTSLYLSDTGTISTSAGSTTIVIGKILSSTTALLFPEKSVTGVDAAYSGNVTVGGTLGVTGAVTLATDTTITKGTLKNTEGDITATKGNLNMTAGNVILTAGYVKQVQVTAKTSDKTLTTAECGNVSVATGASAAITLTLPTAAAGLEYTIFQISGSKNLVVAAGASDVILGDGAADDNTATLTAEIGGSIVLRAMDATNWAVIASHGTWAYTKV
jgi:hypothetical protein